MEDVSPEKTKIIRLQNNCKGYTNLFALETTYKANKNITYYVPNVNIISDDCCTLTSHKKLNEFDEIITKQVNQPFLMTHATSGILLSLE